MLLRDLWLTPSIRYIRGAVYPPIVMTILEDISSEHMIHKQPYARKVREHVTYTRTTRLRAGKGKGTGRGG